MHKCRLALVGSKPGDTCSLADLPSTSASRAVTVLYPTCTNLAVASHQRHGDVVDGEVGRSEGLRLGRVGRAESGVGPLAAAESALLLHGSHDNGVEVDFRLLGGVGRVELGGRLADPGRAELEQLCPLGIGQSEEIQHGSAPLALGRVPLQVLGESELPVVLEKGRVAESVGRRQLGAKVDHVVPVGCLVVVQLVGQPDAVGRGHVAVQFGLELITAFGSRLS